MASSVLLYGLAGQEKEKAEKGLPYKSGSVPMGDGFFATAKSDLDMIFEKFVELYYEDIENRLKETTMRTKKYIIDLKILPYFKDKPINDIKAADIRKWQNKLMKDGYSVNILFNDDSDILTV